MLILSNFKATMLRKAKKRGLYEDFGQKELRQLEAKYNYNPYASPYSDEYKITQAINELRDWAENLTDRDIEKGVMMKKREKLPREVAIKLSITIKDLDAEVYKIVRQDKDDGTLDFYALTFAFPESMGERGFLSTAILDDMPDESEVRGLCINEIKDFIKSKDNFWADACEEDAVVKLKKILKIKEELKKGD